MVEVRGEGGQGLGRAVQFSLVIYGGNFMWWFFLCVAATVW